MPSQPDHRFSALSTSPWQHVEPEIIHTAERFDATTAPVVERTAMLLMQAGARQMVFDAARTRFMTGAGLRSILAVARDLQKVEGQLVLCNLSGQPREIFEACGYDNMLPVFGEQQAALDALELQSPV